MAATAAACLLLAAGLTAAEKPFPPVPQWENLGTVDIVPCPKRIEFTGVLTCGAESPSILFVPDAEHHAETGAAEIAARIAELGGAAAPPVSVPDAAAAVNALTGPAVLIGYGAGDLPMPNVEHEYQGVSAWDEEQGYVIAPCRLNGCDTVLVWGREPLGALYGCITLRHLLSRDGDAVVLRTATVVDWPDFKRRITSGFQGPRDDTEQSVATAVETAKRFVRRAALLKCNAVSPMPWPLTDYLRERELTMLEQLLPYAKRYGVRFHILHFTSVGWEARDKHDPKYATVPAMRGYYMSWSHNDLIRESMDRLRNEVRRLGGNADWAFHYPDMFEGGWPQRSAPCRERWGDDRAAADASFGNSLYQAVHGESASSRLDLVNYPYGMNLDYPGNARTRQYFERLSALLPEDVLFSRREGTRDAFASWWRHIRQPICVWWSPETFWGARALAPDMAFVKSAWRGHAADAVLDCLTVHTRPVLDVSGYTFAEYAWNVAAPGSGIWQPDPAADTSEPASGVVGDYVSDRVLAPDGSPWTRWTYLQGRFDPRAFNYDLVERCCRLIYGDAAAPALAESLRYAPLVAERYWPSDPVIAAALAESADRSFQALAPLWGRKELFQKSPGSQVDTYPVYAQMLKVNTDLRAILGARAAKLAADAKLEEARNAIDRDVKRVAAQAAAESAIQGLVLIEKHREKLREAYQRYELEGKGWYLLLADGYKRRDDVEKKLDAFVGGFRLVREEAEVLVTTAASSARRRQVLVPETAREFAIDGDAAEWPLLNPILITTETCAESAAIRPAPHADAAAVCYMAWDKTWLYVLAKVVDDVAPTAAQGTRTTGDTLHLWVNGNHYAAGTGPDGAAKIETYAGLPPAGAAIAIRPVAAHSLAPDFSLLTHGPADMDGKPGYIAELRLPWEPTRVRPDLDATFCLALGLCDRDDGEQETTELVFPTTYKPLAAGGLLTDFAAARLAGTCPVRFELVDLRKEDRTMQLGTDSFIHARLVISAPVDLTDLRVRFAAFDDDGKPLKSGTLPGVPGILRQGKAWQSDPFELNAGHARENVPLVFTLTANEAGTRTAVTVK
ncbi:MAG: hypothetical protein A3K19_32040 [Lentisphaerae bacterium RIFOXYB12_FULL_65_16]|nr:MAG: hypothetical protein A3K18_10820 [Lentisphaerae bacterium RIFOXYA12_64_32]OGV88733.1 MAG: hypothetical protein A3K19_32040 [Lentisphaerae bacterium RIFOXYB12_FULL_65_16]